MRITVWLVTEARRTGAFITTLDLVDALRARGHEVVVNPTTMIPADVTITHLGDPRAGMVMGKHFLMVHGANVRYRRHLPRRTRSWFPSHNLHQWYLSPPDAVVLPPLIDPYQYLVEPGDRVTLAQATPSKGSAQLYRFAAALPEIPFLAVQSYVPRRDDGLGLLPNVKLVPRFDDVRDMLRQTRILVMPLGGLSWGRAAVEASVSGIPTIATGYGGVREAMLDTGATYASPSDSRRWITLIKNIYGAGFTEASARAQARADQIDYEADTVRLCEAVEETA